MHLHRVGVLFLAVIGQERARASASCVCSSSPSLGRNALVHLHRMHCAPTRSCLNGQLGDGTTTPSAQASEAGLPREGACHRCRWVPQRRLARGWPVLISPTRPCSNFAASGSLPTQVVGFLVLSIILLVSTTLSYQHASGRWRGAQPTSVHGSTSSGRRATGDGRRTKDCTTQDTSNTRVKDSCA